MKVEMLELDDSRPYQDTINKFFKKMKNKGDLYVDIKFFSHNGTSYAVVVYEPA